MSNLIICVRDGCEEEVIKNTHNQKYHNAECRGEATNERLLQKYYAKRDQRLGKVRICNICEETKLSRYNDSLVCSPCELKKEMSANHSVMNMIMAVAWEV